MFVLSSKMYEFLKKLVQIGLPAFSSLYVGLAELWGLPASLQVAGTCALIATFLGIVLGISASTYQKLGKMYDGDMIHTIDEDGGATWKLDLSALPEELEGKESITFKVVKRPLEAG